jgi:hypothetical protein
MPLVRNSRACALSTPILLSNNLPILWYLSLLLSASLFVLPGMEGRIYRVKSIPVLGVLGNPSGEERVEEANRKEAGVRPLRRFSWAM